MFVLSTTYDDSLGSSSTTDNPSFSSTDTKSIPVPSQLLKQIFSLECKALIKKNVKKLLEESEIFGVDEDGVKIGRYEVPNSSLTYELSLVPYSNYEYNLSKSPMEYCFNLMIKPILSLPVVIPPSLSHLSEKRKEYLHQLFTQQRIMVKLPIEPLYKYQDQPDKHHDYLK